VKELIQRRLKLKAKLQKRKRVFGTWTSFGHPSITEIFCRTGCDFIGIDVEHSTISQEQSQRIIAAAQAGGAVCLPRLASHNMEMTKRLLDSGADGLIVPMIDTANQIERVIKWCKYSPQGTRSFGVARAHGYGFDFDEYVKAWNKSSILIAQIESITAVENIKEIFSYEEVDAVMIGPYDLSASLAIPGQLEHSRVRTLCRHVTETCRKLGKSCGIHNIEPDGSSIRRNFSDGYTFVVLASDSLVLWKWSEVMKRHITQTKGR